METPKLKDYAVVMLGYKDPSNIRNRIIELKQQTHPPKEVIVLINHYSEHSSSNLEYFCRSEPFVTFWSRFSHNIGIAYATNLGMKISRSYVTIFLNDDCSIYPDTMERLVEPFKDWDVGVTGVVAGNNPTDAVQTPQGFLIAFKTTMIQDGDCYYDEVANPLACERELCLRLASNDWRIVIPGGIPYKHVHDISNHPETTIYYLGKGWIPLRDQPETEKHLKYKIAEHNHKIRTKDE